MQLGFKATAANLLVVPPYAFACLVTLAVGYVGDRLGHRGYITLLVAFLSIGFLGPLHIALTNIPEGFLERDSWGI